MRTLLAVMCAALLGLTFAGSAYAATTRRQAVRAAQHEAISHHVLLDGRYGAADAWVRWRQEADRRKQQEAGIEQA